MLHQAAFWLMLPISVVQGIWLRRKALRLPGATGERQGAIGKGDAINLLAIGDSIIDGVGAGRMEDALPFQFARALAEETKRCIHWRVEGQTGFAIDDVIRCLAGISAVEQPDIVLISVGVNDVTGLSTTSHWRSRLVIMLDLLNKRWPGAHTLFAGLPPMSLFPLPPQPLKFSLGLRAAMMDRIAAETIAAYPNVAHVPTRVNPVDHSFCEDGFHPSAESCTLWARELASIATRRDSNERQY